MASAIFGSLKGNQMTPVVGPNGELRYETAKDAQGNPIRRSTGSFFRDVLAGAILGGSVGAEHHAENRWSGGLEGAFVGGQAEQMNLKQQQMQAEQKAKEDYARKTEAEKEASRQKTETERTGIELAKFNLQKSAYMYQHYRDDIATASARGAQEQPVAEMLSRAGYNVEKIGADEAQKKYGAESMTKHMILDLGVVPGSERFDDETGHYSYEKQIGIVTGIDPNKNIPINKAFIDRLVGNGMDAKYSNIKEVLESKLASSDPTISFSQLRTLLEQEMPSMELNLAKATAAQKLENEQAQADEINQRKADEKDRHQVTLQQLANERLTYADKKRASDLEKAFDSGSSKWQTGMKKAQDDAEAAGTDFDELASERQTWNSLTPDEQKTRIMDWSNQRKEASAETPGLVKAAQEDNATKDDKDALHENMAQIRVLNRLIGLGVTAGGTPSARDLQAISDRMGDDFWRGVKDDQVVLYNPKQPPGKQGATVTRGSPEEKAARAAGYTIQLPRKQSAATPPAPPESSTTPMAPVKRAMQGVWKTPPPNVPMG
jgi:hypothetical protein